LWWCRSSVPRSRARHVLAARLQGVRVYVVFDAEDEPPGASADGASGFDSITHPFGV
jgi:hypothetical protein